MSRYTRVQTEDRGAHYPLAQKDVEGYRVCPVRICTYVRTHVSMYVRMFIFCDRSSDLIHYPVLILLHTNIWNDSATNKFVFYMVGSR